MKEVTRKGMSRLFMGVGLLLTGTLFLGLLGIGGLVLYRFIASPPGEAVPLPVEVPSGAPLRLATPTTVPLPTSRPTSVPTATLVVPHATSTASIEEMGSGPQEGGPGVSSPNPESADMPETGLGMPGTLGVGLVLACFLGGARIARRMRAGGHVRRAKTGPEWLSRQ